MKAQFIIILLFVFCPLIFSRSFKLNDEGQEFKDPCAAVKCTDEQICVVKDEHSAFCISRSEVEINNHNTFKRQSPKNEMCGSIECRFGECEVFNATSFVCHCFKGVSGPSCNSLDITGQPCASNPCHGDSVCINLSGNAVCVCGPGRSGPECRDHLSPCQCKNGGVCIQQVPGLFRCRCQQGYGGYLCEYPIENQLQQSCHATGCENGGVCSSLSFKCECLSNYTGSRCESSIPATLSLSQSANFSSPININICNPDVCQNGGSCIQLGTGVAICICNEYFRGPYCEMPLKMTTLETTATSSTTSTTTTAPVNLCPEEVPNPCLNDGVCQYSNELITCKCSKEYTGPFCSIKKDLCSQENACKNGGTCVNGSCTCMPFFTGVHCDIGLKCDPNPCLNDQPCIMIDNKPKCFCTSKYKPPFCEKNSE